MAAWQTSTARRPCYLGVCTDGAHRERECTKPDSPSTPQAQENGHAEGGSAAVSEAAGVEPGQRLRIKHSKALVLFGGTRILQHTGDKGARIRAKDDGCLAVVLRTGFETAQGAPACGAPSADRQLQAASSDPALLVQARCAAAGSLSADLWRRGRERHTLPALLRLSTVGPGRIASFGGLPQLTAALAYQDSS